jgi:hypothetical protein
MGAAGAIETGRTTEAAKVTKLVEASGTSDKGSPPNVPDAAEAAAARY